MTKISLRDYLSGIEELIDNARTEDALAHSRYILTHFPKNIATYRLMGKAYLEAHQHKEARDIFQRVLSSCPDDFVSHIGMSIINEEANDQDASIWNMERAFEAQPSNRAVQDELRRLYGKREGYAPPKVRLTRGALARMYAHGDLYNQAIGELRSALSEDPQRPDLQALLAEMYFKTKRDTDAIEVCSKLIEKLPYCLYANRVMVDILRNSKRDLEAKPYVERVEELDPYAALVDTVTDVESTPADTVMLEQFVIETPEVKAKPIPRAWTGSLSLEDAGFEKEALPDWLSVENIGEPAKEQMTQEPKEPAVLESLESLEAKPTAELGAPPVKTTSAALSEDQIPEWLRELRPATTSFAKAGKEAAASLAGPDSDEAAAYSQSAPAEEKEPLAKAPAFFAEDIEDIAPAFQQSEPVSPVGDDDDLGWLEKLAAQQGAPEEELLIKPEDREAAKPEWLPEEKAEPKRDVLAWLDQIADENTTEQTDSEPQEDVVPEMPTIEPPSPFVEQVEADISETTPTWLKDLSADIEQPATSGETEGEITPRPLEEAPDWLRDLRPSTDEIKAAEDSVEEVVSAETEQPSTAEELSKLDWLGEPGQPEEMVSTVTEKPSTAEELSKLEWLEELGPPKGPPVKAEWVPEVEAVASEGEVEQEAEAPVQAPVQAPLQAPAMSPRRTAALQAEQEAPGRLEQARQSLNYGKLDDAADHYGYLLRRRLLIQDVIADLDAAVHRHPQDATLWQTLGDAYMRNNQLREALDCYTRAEDLL